MWIPMFTFIKSYGRGFPLANSLLALSAVCFPIGLLGIISLFVVPLAGVIMIALGAGGYFGFKYLAECAYERKLYGEGGAPAAPAKADNRQAQKCAGCSRMVHDYVWGMDGKPYCKECHDKNAAASQ